MIDDDIRARLLALFVERKAANARRSRRDNANEYAGSPMFYYCETCGAEMILQEGHVCPVPQFCYECIAEGRGENEALPPEYQAGDQTCTRC